MVLECLNRCLHQSNRHHRRHRVHHQGWGLLDQPSSMLSRVLPYLRFGPNLSLLLLTGKPIFCPYHLNSFNSKDITWNSNLNPPALMCTPTQILLSLPDTVEEVKEALECVRAVTATANTNMGEETSRRRATELCTQFKIPCETSRILLCEGNCFTKLRNRQSSMSSRMFTKVRQLIQSS